jgi:predicted DNA-binding transcriptional regulator AlpA
MEVLTLEQVAGLLHMSHSTAKRLVHVSPERFPPRFEHGGKKVLFHKAAVEKWMLDRSGLVTT